MDASSFKPVVAICPLRIEDSRDMHLIAVTECGVRFYFSTINILDANAVTQHVAGAQIGHDTQPVAQGLFMLHVRLPPGYATVGKPKQVHSAYYYNGTVLMISTPQQDQDLLWSLSSEPFIARTYFAESSHVMQLSGQVWGIAALKDTTAPWVNPLRMARTNQRVALLTNQGVHIIALVRPMGMLRQLLLKCHGPQHDAIKAFFQMQTEQQSSALSLLITCSKMFRGTDVATWATQALMLYGGEPQFYLGDPQMRSPQMFMSRHSPSSPNKFYQQQPAQNSPQSQRQLFPSKF